MVKTNYIIIYLLEEAYVIGIQNKNGDIQLPSIYSLSDRNILRKAFPIMFNVETDRFNQYKTNTERSVWFAFPDSTDDFKVFRKSLSVTYIPLDSYNDLVNLTLETKKILDEISHEKASGLHNGTIQG